MGATAAAHVKDAPAAAPRPSARGRILVVDDEPIVCFSLERLLSSEGEVVAATSAKEALARIEAGERFDVILCDLMMPEMDGQAMHAALAKIAPDAGRADGVRDGRRLHDAGTRLPRACAKPATQQAFRRGCPVRPGAGCAVRLTYTAQESSVRRARRAHALLLPARRLVARGRSSSAPRELGYDALGVADCDGLYGMVRALEAAEELGVRLVVGCEVAIDDDAAARQRVAARRSREGYTNLCKHPDREPRAPPQGARRAKPDEGVPRNQFAGLPLDDVCAPRRGPLVPRAARRRRRAPRG